MKKSEYPFNESNLNRLIKDAIKCLNEGKCVYVYREEQYHIIKNMYFGPLVHRVDSENIHLLFDPTLSPNYND